MGCTNTISPQIRASADGRLLDSTPLAEPRRAARSDDQPLSFRRHPSPTPWRLNQRFCKDDRAHLLVVDEVGYLPLERSAANLLFALVSRRYERGSIIVTSNRGFEQWGEILGDAMVAAALIDRLVHHATMITLKGKSYRLRGAPCLRGGESERTSSWPEREQAASDTLARAHAPSGVGVRRLVRRRLERNTVRWQHIRERRRGPRSQHEHPTRGSRLELPGRDDHMSAHDSGVRYKLRPRPGEEPGGQLVGPGFQGG